ncbi:endoplasmic reticulum metallopeptidase [Thalictrum thalictroides]|uniref:Vacuolar membrane protease n=1 Tax=Thalictrum thalictroides TaxID=46969 RepID=A0A7J6W5W7_THATH|nr:endoplasmic reticulum metallopeptidase [Thalictrum thalictroides]
MEDEEPQSEYSGKVHWTSEADDNYEDYKKWYIDLWKMPQSLGLGVSYCLGLILLGSSYHNGSNLGGPDPWAIEYFAKVAKYPSAQVTAQDLFNSGVIKSATDFQVYKEIAGLSGLDFAYGDVGAVYHTKNDKLELLKSGSLQHLGENMLAFLLHTAILPHLPQEKKVENAEGQNQAVFFDILGTYMVVYRQRFANMLHNSVIMQAILIWTTSLFIGGYPAVVSVGLSILSILLMWIFALSFSVFVSLSLPFICSSPVPYIASPWLVIGLFVAPAVLGALIGQHLGFLILLKYLRRVSSKRKQKQSPGIEASIVELEAERWLFKAGSVQWLVILIVGNFYKLGSSYIALVWLVSPAFAYGFLEATLSPVRSPKPLKLVTLLLGLSVPVIMSAGIFIRLVGTLIGTIVRLDRNPGSTPDWLGNVMVSGLVAIIVCLTLVYLLSYVHLSGAKRPIIFVTCTLFGLSLSAVMTGLVPQFTEDVARAVNVVHVVETTGRYGENQSPISYISLFSTTPGKLVKEIEHIREEGFVCGKSKVIDFVTFTVNYGCWSFDDVQSGWDESDIPIMQVESDMKIDDRITRVSVNTKGSVRWSLAINTEEIEDFKFEENSVELVSVDHKTAVDGWHIIQFSGGKEAPTEFNLTLFWVKNSPVLTQKPDGPLVKLRTDLNRVTPKAYSVLQKLPPWCSIFGKSTFPHSLAFLTSLPVDI